MKFGILRADVEGNYNEKGYPQFPEYVYAETLDLERYHDATTVAHVEANSKKAGLFDEETKNASFQAIITGEKTLGDYSFDNFTDEDKEILIRDKNINIWDVDSTNRYGFLSFHEDQHYSINQTQVIDFHLSDLDIHVPGTTITFRLTSNGDAVKINDRALNEVNTAFLGGQSNFVLLQNDGNFESGEVNYITFTYLVVGENKDTAKPEIRVAINPVQEQAVSVVNNTSNGITDWVSGRNYKVGDDVVYDLVIYNCIEAHTSTETFEIDKFEQYQSITQAEADEFEQILLNGLSNLNNLQSRGENGMDDWRPNALYVVGNDVIYDKMFWNCIEEHTSTETFDYTKFERQGGLSQSDADEFERILGQFNS